MRTGSDEQNAGKQLVPLTRVAGILLLVLTTGCALFERAPSPTSAPTAADPSSTSSTGERDAKTPAKPPAFPAAEPTAKKESSPAESKKPTAPLNLTTLEKRLRETEAIGVFTKLTLKNQVDDLVEQFRELHKRRGTPAQLRQSYDLLFLKVLTLLQDDDPSLANAIVASREAIWGILADPVKFSSL